MRHLTFYLLLFVPTVLCAADWPMFHGSDGENRSKETGLLTVWPKDGPRLIWRIGGIGETVSGYSSVSIQNDRLFTTGNRSERSIVYCFDLAGKKLWEYDNGPAWLGSYPGTRSTPTIDGDYVYDFSALGELVCLRVAAGQKIWDRNILADFESEAPIWALAESIRIDGDRLYCAPGGKKTSFVALDKRTGKTLWTAVSLGEKTGYSSPVLFERGGRHVIASIYAKGVFGVDAETGELLFMFRHEHPFDVNCARPIYHDNHLLLANPDNGAVMVKLTDEDGKIVPKEVWRNRSFDHLFDSVILLDGFLYGSSYFYRGGTFMCVEWKDGSIRYDDRNIGKGSYTWAEGLLYFLSEKGEVLLIRPNPEKCEVISRFSLPDIGDTLTWAHPVVCGKRLYLRNDTVLYCYDLSSSQ